MRESPKWDSVDLVFSGTTHGLRTPPLVVFFRPMKPASPTVVLNRRTPMKSQLGKAIDFGQRPQLTGTDHFKNTTQMRSWTRFYDWTCRIAGRDCALLRDSPRIPNRSMSWLRLRSLGRSQTTTGVSTMSFFFSPIRLLRSSDTL